MTPDIYQYGAPLSGKSSNPRPGVDYIPFNDEGKLDTGYEYLLGLGKSSASGNNSYDYAKALMERTKLDPTKNLWENTLDGRGNLLGMIGTGTQVAGSLFNMLDIGGERDAAKKQMKAQTALARQQYDNNEYQIGLAKSSAAARNEAAQKFGQPSLTPSTTMMS